MVAVPKMLYAADLYLIPESNSMKGMKGFIDKLAKVQRQVSLHITGMLRSAPTDTVDACADILPFHLLVRRLLFHAATRIATLPSTHPLFKHINRVAERYVKNHRAPIHETLWVLSIPPAKF